MAAPPTTKNIQKSHQTKKELTADQRQQLIDEIRDLMSESTMDSYEQEAYLDLLQHVPDDALREFRQLMHDEIHQLINAYTRALDREVQTT